MSKATKPDAPERGPLETLGLIYNHFWSVFLRGIAIIVPVIVTIYLISIAVDLVHGALEPFVAVLQYLGLIDTVRRVEFVSFLVDLNVYPYVVDFLSEIIALAILLSVVMLVGSVGHNRYGERVISGVDMVIASIPGIGTVYKSFRRMGDVMLTDEGDNFQDIKLVQCLDEDMYVIGFQTSSAPEVVEDATTGRDMTTLFVPMAPNPVTGGFLTYVPSDRVYDVDMTIEDGVKSILTSGVATGQGAAEGDQLSFDDVRNVAQVDRIQDAIPGRVVETEETDDPRWAEDSADDSTDDDSTADDTDIDDIQ